MYADPAKIRSYTVKLRLNEEEHKLINALADYTGEQKAVLLREIIIEQAISLIDINDSEKRFAM